MQTSTNHSNVPSAHQVKGTVVRKLISKRSFATLATTSPAGRPHSAGVLYELVGDMVYFNALKTSRKARNIAANGHVGLCIPVRRLPVGPPSSIHFQANATLLDLGHQEIDQLVVNGALKSLTSHGELDLPDGCFVRIDLPRRVNTYGLGMSLRKLIANPLSAGGISILNDTTVKAVEASHVNLAKVGGSNVELPRVGLSRVELLAVGGREAALLDVAQ